MADQDRNYQDECGDHGYTNSSGNPCGRPAGWGTDFDSGGCRHHRGTNSDGSSHEGNDNAVGNDGGPPEENQNAQTHALFSEHDGYYQDLDDEDQEWVFDFTHSLLDRLRERQGTEPDMFDREALKNIAIDFHRIAHANGYFRDKGLVQTNYQGTMEGRVPLGDEVNVWASEIRQYNESIYRRMQKHGLLDDPESQTADATRSIAQILSED